MSWPGVPAREGKEFAHGKRNKSWGFVSACGSVKVCMLNYNPSPIKIRLNWQEWPETYTSSLGELSRWKIISSCPRSLCILATSHQSQWVSVAAFTINSMMWPLYERRLSQCTLEENYSQVSVQVTKMPSFPRQSQLSSSWQNTEANRHNETNIK